MALFYFLVKSFKTLKRVYDFKKLLYYFYIFSMIKIIFVKA